MKIAGLGGNGGTFNGNGANGNDGYGSCIGSVAATGKGATVTVGGAAGTGTYCLGPVGTAYQGGTGGCDGSWPGGGGGGISNTFFV